MASMNRLLLLVIINMSPWELFLIRKMLLRCKFRNFIYIIRSRSKKKTTSKANSTSSTLKAKGRAHVIRCGVESRVEL